jgi:hypothetical protein
MGPRKFLGRSSTQRAASHWARPRRRIGRIGPSGPSGPSGQIGPLKTRRQDGAFSSAGALSFTKNLPALGFRRFHATPQLDSYDQSIYNHPLTVVSRMATQPLSSTKGLSMSRRFRITALSIWPGLAQIWSGQEVLGLLLGVLFAATVNLAVVSRWVWTGSFPPGWSGFFAALAVVTWLASVGYTAWWAILCHPERHRAEIEKLFRDAQEAYLQGRWLDCKHCIERILARDENDADALMQLGSVYVRTGEPALARHAFQQCLESRGGNKWQWEIKETLARLNRG